MSDVSVLHCMKVTGQEWGLFPQCVLEVYPQQCDHACKSSALCSFRGTTCDALHHKRCECQEERNIPGVQDMGKG